MGDVTQTMKDVSVFSFKDGIAALPMALSKRLDTMPSVQSRLSSGVASLEPQEEGVKIHLLDGNTVSASHVVSALPLPKLDSLLQQNPLPHLKYNPSTTVTVVNLVFPCAPSDLHPAGFGYLVPRPADGYESATGLGILGTVFDSCALSAQDRAGSQPITKLTVMCGGPYHASSFSVEALVDELFRHLRRPKITPIHVGVHKQVDCIPLPLVGHLDRMSEVQRILAERPWNGRLSVIGAGVSGAGISDCVKAAREAALGFTS